MKIFRTGAYETFYDFPLVIGWDITMRCNYRCSYCFDKGGVQNKISSRKPFSTLTQLKAAVNNIASLNRPWYEINFSGGEPTLHPHLVDLIVMLHEKLEERLNKVLIITNGSRNMAFYKKIADIKNLINITMQISIHTEQVDMAHILELIETLSKDINIRLALMFNPVKREEVHLIYDILFEYRKIFPFSMNINLLRDSGLLVSRYTKEDFEWQREATLKFNALENVLQSKIPAPKKLPRSMRIFYDAEQNGERKIIESANRAVNLTNGLLKFTGMYCIANSSLLYIQEDENCHGMVCPADLFIFNIYEEDAITTFRNEMIHGIKCPMPLCDCSANDHIPKFSSYEEAVQFIRVIREKQENLSKQTK